MTPPSPPSHSGHGFSAPSPAPPLFPQPVLLVLSPAALHHLHLLPDRRRPSRPPRGLRSQKGKRIRDLEVGKRCGLGPFFVLGLSV
ncbi:hypothetical protein Tsubulata_043869 [Turnera subulata]|uniref:Uncharacterized protein n=1 Tax=Turnera subulata TaxID=218843 RepID=A0A9Q0FGK4_9ROSI|nr:hypothetical protein Tsubulata_043869 [Turnera subulata]